jgi:ABC-type phosphate transport system substrate-binding protein
MMKPQMIRVLLAASCLAASVSTVSANEIVVIVNAANPAVTLDKAAVKAYYLKQRPTWADGEKVRSVDIPDDPAARTAFVTTVLGLSIAEFERHWIAQQYASGDGPPSKAPDEAAVIKLVQLFKGGIGFVSRAALEKAGDVRVKVVLTVQ